METSPPSRPAADLATQLYYQLIYTLTDLLPPPLDDAPEAPRARNHAAIAKVAALLPVNANEIDLAAQCTAARAQAEEMLRLVRQNADDIGLVMRLNAEYGSMVRTSLSVQGRLMRIQAVRQKRERSKAPHPRTRGLCMSPSGLCCRWQTRTTNRSTRRSPKRLRRLIWTKVLRRMSEKMGKISGYNF